MNELDKAIEEYLEGYTYNKNTGPSHGIVYMTGLPNIVITGRAVSVVNWSNCVSGSFPYYPICHT